jgi:hypothetical protein
MKRPIIIAVLVGAALLSAIATSVDAQTLVYRRPLLAPPRPAYSYYYRPWSYYAGPRAYYWSDYYGPRGYFYYNTPRSYSYRYYGPQVYRPYWAPGLWR